MSEEPFANTLRSIFLRWERWRIAYNLILVVWTLIVVGFTYTDAANWRGFAIQCVLGATFANICYFAGPIFESYVQWLGLRSRAITPVIFTSGLLFSMVLAAVTVLAIMNPSNF